MPRAATARLTGLAASRRQRRAPATLRELGSRAHLSRTYGRTRSTRRTRPTSPSPLNLRCRLTARRDPAGSLRALPLRSPPTATDADISHTQDLFVQFAPTDTLTAEYPIVYLACIPLVINGHPFFRSPTVVLHPLACPSLRRSVPFSTSPLPPSFLEKPLYIVLFVTCERALSLHVNPAATPAQCNREPKRLSRASRGSVAQEPSASSGASNCAVELHDRTKLVRCFDEERDSHGS